MDAVNNRDVSNTKNVSYRLSANSSINDSIGNAGALAISGTQVGVLNISNNSRDASNTKSRQQLGRSQ